MERMKLNLPYIQKKMFESGYTSYELAKVVGLKPNSIWRILVGKQEPSAVVAVRLASALNTTVEDLFHCDSTTEKVL